jgi:electron transport complex protein RnfG
MSEHTTISPTGNSKKMLLAMSGIGTLCALLIVLTYESTLPRVNRLKADALEKAIFQVLPGVTQTKIFTINEENALVLASALTGGPQFYAGYDANGRFKGLAIEGLAMGYADKIRVLYGYDPIKQEVIGFHVLETKETPGLGDKIEKDETFLDNFKALDARLNPNGSALAHAIITVKNGEKEEDWQIDGITGATISSRAVGVALKESLQKGAPILVPQTEVLLEDKKKLRP